MSVQYGKKLKLPRLLPISKDGTLRAYSTNELTEYMTRQMQTPLETLVVAQLAAIRKREAELQTRLQSGNGFEPTNVAAEVWQLQTSADRLSRMMDAMNYLGTEQAFAV